MRKIILFNMVTLDGFFEGPNQNIEWHHVDDEFNQFAIDQLGSAGGLIFGRITYQMMASYWPTLMAIEDDPVVASKMNEIPKIVFSRTLGEAGWNNTRLVRTDAAEEVSRLKQQPGKDLLLFGSAKLAASLIQKDLIDELRAMVNPIILGGGIPLFQGIREPVHLALLESRVFKNGNVLLSYRPVEK